jgi:cysteine-rich repeat protein
VETCDDGNHAIEDCPYGQTTCQVCGPACNQVPGYTAYCGDRQINGTETCDDGNNTTACAYGQTSCMVCTPTCTRTAGTTAFCGDGTINGPETCDDGNNITESCPTGQPSCMVCGQGCTMVQGGVARCGDGIINGTEQCDDGNSTTESCPYGQPACPVCNAQCQTVAGATHRCGDGVVDAQETCDDGNTTASDGCSASCHTEAPWTCTGAPSTCTVGKIQVTNNTSFPIVSLIVDGVEQIPLCPSYLPKPGDPLGSNQATVFVTLGGNHTLAASNGQWQVDANNNCAAGSQRLVYDLFPAISVPVPTTSVVSHTYTNLKTLNQMLAPTGLTCWYVAYAVNEMPNAQTREARFSFSQDGSWVFREIDNQTMVETRASHSLPLVVETSRGVGHTAQFNINTWRAQFDETTRTLVVENLALSNNGSFVYNRAGTYAYDANGHCPP